MRGVDRLPWLDHVVDHREHKVWDFVPRDPPISSFRRFPGEHAGKYAIHTIQKWIERLAGRSRTRWRAGPPGPGAHGDAVNDVRFLPDGQILSASDDGTAA